VLVCIGFILALWVGFRWGAAERRTGDVNATLKDTTGAVTLYTCSMHPQVMQPKPGVCPICNMKLVPIKQEPTAQAPGAGTSAAEPGAGAPAGAPGPKKTHKIAYYWDPMMNPPYISSKPGKSPMGMDLVPVYEDEEKGGPVVTIDPVVTQNIGIRVAVVTEGPLHDAIRAVGYFRAAEPNQYDVTLKTGGYVERLYANTEGILVEKDAPLFDLYSPELLVAEEELLAAERALDALPADADTSLRAQSQALFDNVRSKLAIWNVPDREITALLSSGTARHALTFRSPARGFIIEKNVVEGASVMAGERLFRIVDLSVLWLDAQIYENQLPYVTVGQNATATAQGLGGRAFDGKIIFVNPVVSADTRTATARLVFENPGYQLKPGMFATVDLGVKIADRAVQAPREAVIDTGKRKIVFIARSGGRFEPRDVRVGAETEDGIVEILAGLAPGDTIVTSGQFLLDTESRTREAIEKLTRKNLLAPGGKAPGAQQRPAPAPKAAASEAHKH
jgi:RND family efflux transporter MFP subunit